MTPDLTSPHPASAPASSPSPIPVTVVPAVAVEAILQALSGLRYGQVTVIVQDGRVMQIERTDRFRLPATVATTADEPRPAGAK